MYDPLAYSDTMTYQTLNKVGVGLGIVVTILTAGMWAGSQTADMRNVKEDIGDIKIELTRIRIALQEPDISDHSEAAYKADSHD